VSKVTKGYIAEFMREGEENKVGIQGRINYFDDTF
jgi:hypothetical protein